MAGAERHRASQYLTELDHPAGLYQPCGLEQRVGTYMVGRAPFISGAPLAGTPFVGRRRGPRLGGGGHSLGRQKDDSGSDGDNEGGESHGFPP